MKLRPIQPLLTKIQETVNERLNQMQILQNHRKFPEIIKDQELKSQTRRNLRLIKQHQLLRISQQDRTIAQIPSLKYFSKQNTMLLEQILVKLMNKYLKSQFTTLKRGLFDDLVIIFQKYYYHINHTTKLRQMTVIKNQNIVEDVDFARKNILIFVINTRSSMNSLLNKERLKFYHASRQPPKQINLVKQSPQKRNMVSVDNDPQTRRILPLKKKQYSNYVSQISKLLVLESGAMSNAAYFQKSQSLDSDRKMSIMEMNFIKKNLQVKESISSYSAQYTSKTNNN